MIRLGPLGLKKGIKRIINLLVEEISLVDSPAIRRKFLLIKRDFQEKDSVDLKLENKRRISSMELKETKDLEDGEVMVFERNEELALPPDVVRTLKVVIGQLSKLIGYKYKAKYKYEKPAEKKPDEETKPTTEETQAIKDKAKAEETKEKEKVNLEETEVSKDIADALTDLSKLMDSDAELDTKDIREQIGEILEKVNDGLGGGKE